MISLFEYVIYMLSLALQSLIFT